MTCNDIDECNLGTDSCSVYADCTNLVGAYSCSCGAGFAGDGITCSAVCGDGLTVATEQCDDSGTVSGDGCDDSCDLETPSCSLTLTPTTGSVPLVVT